MCPLPLVPTLTQLSYRSDTNHIHPSIRQSSTHSLLIKTPCMHHTHHRRKDYKQKGPVLSLLPPCPQTPCTHSFLPSVIHSGRHYRPREITPNVTSARTRKAANAHTHTCITYTYRQVLQRDRGMRKQKDPRMRKDRQVSEWMDGWMPAPLCVASRRVVCVIITHRWPTSARQQQARHKKSR